MFSGPGVSVSVPCSSTVMLELEDVYAKLIKKALEELRKEVKDTGYLNGKMHILPPLDTGGRVEVLFLVGKDPQEPMTAWFEDVDEPELLALATGW